jgi:ribonuclease T1
MKRINWLSLVFGIVLTLALVSACNILRTRKADVSQSPITSPVVDEPKSPMANGLIEYARLPREAQSVIQTIKARGQFPYSKDGSVFGNREGLLPRQPGGYYQEYTVKTPKVDNRGARRIVAGKGKTGDVATSGEYYYTADHYRTFYRVVEK